MSKANNNSQVDDNDERPSVHSVAGIILNILTAINNNSIDAINEDSAIMNNECLEDTPVEQTLCAIWDLSSLEEYADIFMNECQIHRIMLKIITLTERKRTEELSLGILANLACFSDRAVMLIGDMDLFNVIQIILKNEDSDVRVLLEASRFVKNILTNLPNYTAEKEFTILKFLFENNLVSRFNYFLNNTLNDELLIISLEILKWIPCIGIPEKYLEIASLNIIESFNNICERVNIFKDIDRKLFITIISLINTFLETGLIPQNKFVNNYESLYRLRDRFKNEYFDEEDDEMLNLIEIFNNKIELSEEKMF